MIVDFACPLSRVKKYGAWSAWPYYLVTPESCRTGELKILHHMEYMKNGVVYRKVNGKWIKKGG